MGNSSGRWHLDVISLAVYEGAPENRRTIPWDGDRAEKAFSIGEAMHGHRLVMMY
jgi:hypothetical protein